MSYRCVFSVYLNKKYTNIKQFMRTTFADDYIHVYTCNGYLITVFSFINYHYYFQGFYIS